MSDSNGFSNKEILVRLETKVDAILADHEARLRGTENSVSRVKGALALLVVLMPVAAALAAAFIH